MMLPSCMNKDSLGANLIRKTPRFARMVPQAYVFLETRSFKSFGNYQNTDYDSCRDMVPSNP